MTTAVRTPTVPIRHAFARTMPNTFLRPIEERPADLDFDTAQRFGLATELLNRLLTGATAPVKILDVGCNVLNLLPAYFERELVRVTRCDTFENVAHDPHYVQIVPGDPLPFGASGHCFPLRTDWR